MHQLPEEGYLRLPQIIGNPKADPPIPAVIPVGKSTWWAGVKSGKYPKPIKLSPHVTAWSVQAIRDLIEQARDDAEPAPVKRQRKAQPIEPAAAQ